MAKFVRLPMYDDDGMMLKEYLEIDIFHFFNVPFASVKVIPSETTNQEASDQHEKD